MCPQYLQQGLTHKRNEQCVRWMKENKGTMVSHTYAPERPWSLVIPKITVWAICCSITAPSSRPGSLDSRQQTMDLRYHPAFQSSLCLKWEVHFGSSLLTYRGPYSWAQATVSALPITPTFTAASVTLRPCLGTAHCMWSWWDSDMTCHDSQLLFRTQRCLLPAGFVSFYTAECWVLPSSSE